MATFQGLIGLSPESPVVLFSAVYFLNGLMLLIYVVMQIILVINTLDDRWPLGKRLLGETRVDGLSMANSRYTLPTTDDTGDILFGLAFFILGQIFEMFLSNPICEAAKHYVDGLFFGTICSLLGVMMVYKYWDSITKEDLEFSVGGKANVWEIRDEFDEK